MKVEENILQEILRLALADTNNRPKSFQDQFKSLMFNMYNITGGEATDILNGKLPVELMQKDTMFKLTKVLYELNKRPESTFDFKKLNIDDYFTDKEKNEFNKNVDRKSNDEDIVIKQWLQVNDDQYIIVVPMDDVLSWVNKNKIKYNPETQRDLTIKETKSGQLKKVTLFEDSLKDIYDAMENNRYISDALSLNINPDFNAPPRILRGNLIIPNESNLDCIDGFHRLTDAILVKLKHPDWNQNFIFNLMVFDKDKAVQFIIQEDKKNHLTDEQVSKSDAADASNFIIDKLNKSNNFHLRNTIDDNMSVTLNKIITKLFNPHKLYSIEDRQDAVRLYSIIEKNINELVEQYNLFNTDVTKEMWFIYLYTLKYTLDNKLNFIECINKINMGNLLQQIQFTNQPINKHYKIMNEVISNV
jgi:hypothetical protein